MLSFESDISHADWVLESGVGWRRLVTSGPPGYEDGLRVTPLPEDDMSERSTWSALQPHFRKATATPEDCFFALWTGASGVAFGNEPGFSQSVLRGPTMVLLDAVGRPVREYRLFRGSLGDVGTWGTWDPASRQSLDHELPPAHLAWPADRAWFVASDVDADAIWISGSARVIEGIHADPALNTLRVPEPG